MLSLIPKQFRSQSLRFFFLFFFFACSIEQPVVYLLDKFFLYQILVLYVYKNVLKVLLHFQQSVYII
jgi:hypothetical protein